MEKVTILYEDGRREILPRVVFDEMMRKQIKGGWRRVAVSSVLSGLALCGWEGEKIYKTPLGSYAIVSHDGDAVYFDSIDGINQFFESRAY